jgi:hypothetical protein
MQFFNIQSSVFLILLLFIHRYQAKLSFKRISIMGGQESKPTVYDETMYNGVPTGVTLDEKIQEFNGRRINTVRWTPAGAPKAIVFIAHGLHEHCMRYYTVAAALTAQGYLVIGMDHAAHGLSEGTRGFISDYTFMTSDFKSLCTAGHEEFPKLPCFIVCHSMGTMITLLSINDLPFIKVSYFHFICL